MRTRTWFGAALAATGAGGTAVELGEWWLLWPEWSSAWSVATTNSALARWINSRAIGRGDNAFLRWVLLGHGLRVVALLAAVVGAHALGARDMTAFVVVLFVCYFCFLAAEIAVLNKMDVGRLRQR